MVIIKHFNYLILFPEINECSKNTAVTVSRFEQHVAELSLNDNEGFRQQFEVCIGQ
jgi:hypothetical protein